MSRFRVVVVISAIALALGQSAKAQTSSEQAAGAKQDTAETASAAGEKGAQAKDLQNQIQELRQMILQQQTTIREQQDKMIALTAEVEAGKLPNPITVQPAVYSANSTLAMATAPALAPAAPAPLLQGPGEEPASPLQFRLGTATFTPVGFMDFTSISRSTNAGSGIGTNFGSIPFSNTQAGSLTETRFSPQNSRLGMRIDAKAKGANVMGYWESDFLGQLGNPPNGGLSVSSNPYVFRLRLFWVDVRKSKWEVLAGQSWSMMTPNRKGISPLPGDLFFSQNVDVNYQLGLTWGRIPGFRVVYHPTAKVAFGVALENSEPYVGGANGGGAITAPAGALGGILGTQVNNGTSVITAPALFPDVIAKLAFDPSSKFHIELTGLEIANKISNPVSVPPFQTSTKSGVGGSINLNFELFKNFRLVTNNFWSDGGGRYIFGQAPDFILRADGTISTVHSGSTVSGFEYTAGKSMPTLFYGYYGGVYIQRNTALDANGTSLVGYGYSGSPSGQNRAIQEITFGTNTTLWKDAKFGALNVMFQFSHVMRNPWFVASGQPSDAHVEMGFFNLRYTLPGAAPAIK